MTQMPQMTAFSYGGFYDVPRCISIYYRGEHFLLASWFDEDLDEYPDEYSILRVSSSSETLLPCTRELLETPHAYLGKIPIARVTFDERKREKLDASILDAFLNGDDAA